MIRSRVFCGVLVALMSFGLIGCDGSSSSQGNGTPSFDKAMDNWLEATKEAASAGKQEVQRLAEKAGKAAREQGAEKGQQFLDELDQKMEDYAETAKARGGAVQEEFNDAREDFDTHRQKADNLLQQVKAGGEQAWDRFGDGFDKAMRNVLDAYNRARRAVKETETGN